MTRSLCARILSVIAGLLLLAGCASGTSTEKTTAPNPSPSPSSMPSQTPTAEPLPIAGPFHVRLTEVDDGTSTELAVGGTLVVTLGLDPASDMVWFVGEGSGEQLGDYCGGDRITNDAGTTQTLTFRALATGTAPLVLELKTPETDMEPASTFTATVQVVDSPDPPPPAGTPTSVELGTSDSGTTVQLANHGQLTVVLPGQPGLGYTWSLADYPAELLAVYCPIRLAPPGSTTEQPPEANRESVVTFDAIAPGTAEIVLEYRNDNAPDDAPEQTFRVTVDIPYCEISWGTSAKEGTPGGQGGESVTDVRTEQYACYDRLEIDLNAPVVYYSAFYNDGDILNEDGTVLVPLGDLRGGSQLAIYAEASSGAGSDYAPPNPAELSDVAGYETFRQVTLARGTTGSTWIGLGVRERLPFRVLTLDGRDEGTRLVIDVAHRP